jgi:hypothetical protein
LDKIKENIESIQTSILDLNDAIITVKQLHVNLNFSLSELNKYFNGFLVLDDVNITDVFAEYASMLKSGVANGIIGLSFEITFTVASLPSMIGTAASFASAGLAIFACIVTVAFTIVDIISSVREERRVRDELIETKYEYIRVRQKLEKAHNSMISLQKSFCKNVVEYLRRLSETGKKYEKKWSETGKKDHKLFESLYNYVVRYFGTSERSCRRKNIFSSRNLWTLTTLKESHIDPILEYFTLGVEEVKEKITEVSKKSHLLEQISKDVKSERKHPAKIFEVVKRFESLNSKIFFPNLFDLLRHISINVLPNTGCYKEYNLALIRSGQITAKNLNSTACTMASSKSQDQINTIKDEVKNGTIPCLIYLKVRGDEFRSKYIVLRYIAENILPKSNCYWGFDLQAIRNNPNVGEIEKAKLSSSIFIFLDSFFQYFNITPAGILFARSHMCREAAICNSSWQSFIMCSLLKNVTTSAGLDCTTKASTEHDKYCVPPLTQFQSCSS